MSKDDLTVQRACVLISVVLLWVFMLITASVQDMYRTQDRLICDTSSSTYQSGTGVSARRSQNSQQLHGPGLWESINGLREGRSWWRPRGGEKFWHDCLHETRTVQHLRHKWFSTINKIKLVTQIGVATVKLKNTTLGSGCFIKKKNY